MELSGFETVELSLNRPLLVVKGSRGVLACGYLSLDVLEKNGDAAALVRGVASFGDMLDATVRDVTAAARELGVSPEMTGREALERFR
ncbi:MAG: DUF1805 domain-containing protein [Planctomycetota bacterium]